MVALARTILALAAAVGLVAAQNQLKIISPGGSDLWWVANSNNVLLWDCRNSQIQNFTVLIANSNANLLVQPLAIIAIQQNYDCSLLLTPQQANFTPSTGYTVILANPLNSTDHYGVSQPFEVKAQGSPYPASSATPTGTATSGSGSSSGSGTASASSTATQANAKSSASKFALPGILSSLLAGGFAFLAI